MKAFARTSITMVSALLLAVSLPAQAAKAKKAKASAQAPKKAGPKFLPSVTVAGELYALSWHKKNLYEFVRPMDQASAHWESMFVLRDHGKGKADVLDAQAEANLAGLKVNGAVLEAKTLPKTRTRPATNVIVGTIRGKGSEPNEYVTYVFRLADGHAYSTWMSVHYTDKAALDALEAGRERRVEELLAVPLPKPSVLEGVAESTED